jgi:hypothetical protein
MTGEFGTNNYISTMTIGSLEDLGFLGVDYSLADAYDLSNLSNVGCGTYCSEATGINRRLVPGRRALSDDAAHKMECYALKVLLDARAGEQKVMPEDTIDMSRLITTVYWIDEYGIVHGKTYRWEDVKGIGDTC